jgi:hypothetical protein
VPACAIGFVVEKVIGEEHGELLGDEAHALQGLAPDDGRRRDVGRDLRETVAAAFEERERVGVSAGDSLEERDSEDYEHVTDDEVRAGHGALDVVGGVECATTGELVKIGGGRLLGVRIRPRAFAEFHKSLCGPAVNTPFVLFTLEGAIEKAYWGRLRSIELLERRAGVIMIDALLGWQSPTPDWVLPSNETYPLAIPRGVIQGWRTGPEGRLYLAQCTLGYADGNEPARRAYHAMVAQRMPPRRGSPRLRRVA